MTGLKLKGKILLVMTILSMVLITPYLRSEGKDIDKRKSTTSYISSWSGEFWDASGRSGDIDFYFDRMDSVIRGEFQLTFTYIHSYDRLTGDISGSLDSGKLNMVGKFQEDPKQMILFNGIRRRSDSIDCYSGYLSDPAQTLFVEGVWIVWANN